MALFPYAEPREPLSAEAYATDKPRLEEEARRLGMSVRKLTAHIFKYWLEQVEQERSSKEEEAVTASEAETGSR